MSRFSLVALTLSALASCVAPTGDDAMAITDQFVPRPSPLIGAGAPPATPIAPDLRVNQPGDYSATVPVQPGVDLTTSAPIVTDVLSVNWQRPIAFSLISVAKGFVDPGDASLAVSSSAPFNVCTAAKIRLRVSYGDANQRFSLDVLAGQAISLTGSYCRVQAYVSGNLGGTPAPVPAGPSSKMQATVTVLAVEGETSPHHRPVITGTYSNLQTQSGGNWLRAEGGPCLLKTLTGYQTSGAAAWLQLFDTSPNAVTYSGPTRDQHVANGTLPLYEIYVPDGSNFSLGLPDGLVAQHGLMALWSSTPGTLTILDAGNDPYSDTWSGPFVINFTVEPLATVAVSTQ